MERVEGTLLLEKGAVVAGTCSFFPWPGRSITGSAANANAIDAETRSAAVIAAHEVAANAIEHGQCNEIELEGRLEPEHTIYLEVRADGTWKPPSTENDERGRGLQLIHGLMESVTIDTHPDHTSIRMRRRYSPITDEI